MNIQVGSEFPDIPSPKSVSKLSKKVLNTSLLRNSSPSRDGERDMANICDLQGSRQIETKLTLEQRNEYLSPLASTQPKVDNVKKSQIEKMFGQTSSYEELPKKLNGDGRPLGFISPSEAKLNAKIPQFDKLNPRTQSQEPKVPGVGSPARKDENTFNVVGPTNLLAQESEEHLVKIESKPYLNRA